MENTKAHPHHSDTNIVIFVIDIKSSNNNYIKFVLNNKVFSCYKILYLLSNCIQKSNSETISKMFININLI